MTPEEAQRAQAVVTFLNGLVPAGWAFFVECHKAPAEGSFLERAKKDSDLVLVLDAALWIDAAGDFFLTLVEEFQFGQIHRFSPYTSLRGALECDAWACWPEAAAFPEKEVSFKSRRRATAHVEMVARHSMSG